MQMKTTPGFKEFFNNEPTPNIAELLEDIPSKCIIGIFSKINAEVSLQSNSSNETQQKCYNFLTQRFTKEQKLKIYLGLKPFFDEDKENFTLFSSLYLVEFIKHELINHREIEIADTTPEQEYRIFIAYLCIIEIVNNKHVTAFENLNSGVGYFQEATWPMIIHQFEVVNVRVDPFIEAFKALNFLVYFEKHEQYKKYVTAFLEITNSPNLYTYVFKFLGLVQGTSKMKSDGYFEHTSLVNSNDTLSNEFLDSLCIDIENYKNSLQKQKEFFGLKEAPLYKYSQNTYAVIDWNFFFNQINNGLLFNFHKISGIKAEFPTIPIFKSFIGNNISEKTIFQKITTRTLKRKHSVLKFDDEEIAGAPDLYFRNNKDIFLFEFKDYLISSEVINNSEFQQFKNEIDKKFIRSDEVKIKGVLQLTEQIKKVAASLFDFDDYTTKFKQSSMTIYPIIVVTNPYYSIPGIEEYLNTIFKKRISEINQENNLPFKKINDVVIIQLDFFLKSFLEFEEGKVDFISVIDEYFESLNRLRKRATKDPMNVEKFLDSNTNFEQQNFKLTHSIFQNKNYVKEIFRTLELLPAEHISSAEVRVPTNINHFG